jgi:hypothetical protein
MNPSICEQTPHIGSDRCSPRAFPHLNKKVTVFDPSKSKNWKALRGYTWLSNTPTRAVRLELSVSGQAVEIATRVSSSFIADTANNVLLGLGSSSLNTGEIPRSVSSLNSPVFTVDLKYHAPGTLTPFLIPQICIADRNVLRHL